MPRVPFGMSSYKRGRGDLPTLPCVNMFAEEAPTEETGIAMQSRPGLSDRTVGMGAGPVDALFKRDSVLGSALFGVSGGRLYRETDDLGAIDGAGPASIAGYEQFLFAAAGAGLWGYNGTTLTQIAFPDSAAVSKVIVAQSRAVAIRKDTGKFYWSKPLGSTIDALDFATAEAQPDRLRDCLFIDNILILFGAETVEFWPATTDANLPFAPLQGRVIERGIKGTGCATPIGSTFAWVTDRNQVCLQDENTILSNPGLEEQIEASATCRLFTFMLGGVEFLALRLDNETQIWSYRSKLWSQFASYRYSNWLAQCWSGGVFGSAVDGRTFTWSTGHVDLGDPLERRLSFGMPINSAGVTVNNLQVRCNIGQTPFLTGDYADPTLEMRLSRDAGRTWGQWRGASLGAQGQYRTKPQWRACGMASHPGLFGQIRVTDPVDWRVSDVLVNEPFGGR